VLCSVDGPWLGPPWSPDAERVTVRGTGEAWVGMPEVSVQVDEPRPGPLGEPESWLAPAAGTVTVEAATVETIVANTVS